MSELKPMFYSVTDLQTIMGLEYETARRQMKAFEQMGITARIGKRTMVYRESFHELFRAPKLKNREVPEGWRVVEGGRG